MNKNNFLTAVIVGVLAAGLLFSHPALAAEGESTAASETVEDSETSASVVTTEARETWVQINGKYYYFKANGKIYKPKKARFRKLGGKTCYFYTDGHVAVGRVKIGKKYYYFNKKGVLQRNRHVVQIKNKYYSTNAKGVMTRISAVKAKCHTAVWRYINRHSNSSQTSLQRLRSCFNYLLNNMQYRHFSMSYSYSVIDKKNGIYELALYMLESDDLSGNCHNFASCIALIAKELGFRPTMVTMKGDHSFVIINGGYYDNMYDGLFGASSRPAYSVYKTVTL